MAKKLATLILFSLYLYFLTTDFSAGNAYFNKIVDYKNAINRKDWVEARSLERQIDKKIVRPLKEAGYPEYQEIQIQRILSKKKQDASTSLQVAQLYYKLGDKQNAKTYLELAKSYDPVREDIRQALLSL